MPVLPFPKPAPSTACFVRIRERRADGFVEFDFAMGDPGLTVELILPEAAFHEFCATHHVRHLTQEEAHQVDVDQTKWRYGQPGVDA